MTFRSDRWLAATRSLGFCVLCKTFGVEAAHKNEGKAKGAKQSDASTAALCRTCHVKIDSGKDLTRDERRSLMNHAIVLTHEKLAELGVLTCGVDNIRDAIPPKVKRKGSTATPEKCVPRRL